MKSILLAAASLIILTIPTRAHAIPSLVYNPATGGIWLSNDTGAHLGAIAVISATNNVKTDPSLFTAIPGATFDPGDLPLGFTYLNFPPTNSLFGTFVGNVITPGTPTTDLSGVYYESLSNGSGPKPLGFIFPEPASGGIALWAGVAMLAASRRRRS